MGGRRKDGRGGVGRTLTARQEAVAVAVAAGMRMAEAMMQHGYSEAYARSNGALVLHDNVCFQRRLAALRERAAAPIVAQLTGKILSEHERKVILSEIAAASLSDYVLAGPDGDEVSITKDSPNPHALAEVQTRTDYDSDGSKPRVIQRVKLRDPVGAIDLLNKMDKLYSEGSGQAQTAPNQTFIFNLDGRSVSARELYQRAMLAANNAPEGQVIACTDAPEGQSTPE